MVFSDHAVHPFAHTHYDIAKSAVVHIHDPLDHDSFGINLEGVGLINMVVDHRAKKVVGGTDGMHIPCEMEVDIIHGNHLGITTAGRAAFDPENRPQRGFAESQHTFFPHLAQSLCQTHRNGGFAFPGGSGIDGGNQDQFTVLFVLHPLHTRLPDFGFIMSVQFQFIGLNTGGKRNFGYRQHMSTGRNFNI